MKLTYAATALIVATAASSSGGAVTTDAFTPKCLMASRTTGSGSTLAFVPGAAVHRRPTRNNVGRRRIKTWHNLELQPWSALRMSAAVDEPASTSTSSSSSSVPAVDVDVDGIVSGANDLRRLNGVVDGGSFMDEAITRRQSIDTTKQSTEAYLSSYEKESGAAVIYSKLQDHGVTVVNGYSGGAILPLLDQFHEDHPRHNGKEPIRWITNSNESSAGHVAEGIAKSSTGPDGRLAAGVVVATSGPGVTNLVTPLQDAMCDGVPLVVLCGQAATTAPEAAFQFAPAVDITRPCTKWSYQIQSAVEIPFVMDYAFYVARHGRPGPVFVDLPKDLQNQVITAKMIEEFVANLEVMEMDGEDGNNKLPKFVKLLEQQSKGENTMRHDIHLGSAEEGLPFQVSTGGLEPVPLDGGNVDDSFRMDHHLSNTIYAVSDDQQGPLLEEGGSEILRDLVRTVRQAKNPVIIAGQGCNDASEELTKLAETLQIPVTTTLLGLGCFDERHPLALNMLGMHGHPTPNYMVQESDMVICIGSRFDDRITGRIGDFIPEARKAEEEGRGGVIHVDVRLSEHSKQVRPTFFVHSTGKAFLRAVNDELSRYGGHNSLKGQQEPITKLWLGRMEHLQREFPVGIPKYEPETVKAETKAEDGTGSATTTTITELTKTKMSAQHVIATMNDLLLRAGKMDECIFSTGVGIHQMVSAQLLTWTRPRQMLSSGSLGTMGVALGYAVGAKLANGRRIVIAVDGDGSFNMTFTELKTVAEQRIPVKIMILDNESQMMVEYWQRLFHDGRYLAVRNQKNPDYTTLADAFGIKNLYVDCEEDLEGAMNEFLFGDPDEPVLMHVRIERTPCLPLVAPGQALDSMILVDEQDQEVDPGAAPS